MKNFIELYDYQKEAIEKLKTGSILCGGVGSGKSITSLMYYYTKVAKAKIDISLRGIKVILNNPTPLYIITTARKRDSLDWQKEAIPFLLNEDINLSIQRTIFKIDSWNNIDKYVDVENSFFIFDEQRLVGRGAWVKSFLKIVKHNAWILLSATPGDKWEDYIPVFIANRFYKNRTSFSREHIIYSSFSRYPKVERIINQSKLKMFRDSILVPMNYKKKTQRYFKYINCEYNTKYIEIIKNERWNIYDNEPIKDITEMYRLTRKVIDTDISKINQLINIFSKHTRIIVFYNYNYELAILRKLSNRYIVAEWNGYKHDNIPNTNDWIYLVQYTAGSEGWNCVETNCIVFYSLPYSYKVFEQASGRIDRVNTTYTNLYYYVLTSDAWLSKKIVKSIKNQKDFNIIKDFNASHEKHML